MIRIVGCDLVPVGGGSWRLCIVLKGGFSIHWVHLLRLAEFLDLELLSNFFIALRRFSMFAPLRVARTGWKPVLLGYETISYTTERPPNPSSGILFLVSSLM